MSISFRRPKKPVRPRLVMIGNEEDEEMDDEPSPIQPPPATQLSGNGNGTSALSTKEKKPATVSEPEKSKKSTLLSFDEDLEEDGEVFKVKKSSVSRRLMKQRDKDKKDKPSKSSSSSAEAQKAKMQVEAFTSDIKVGKIKREDSPVLRILNGREAEAVDMESSEEEEEENLKFRRPTQSAIQEELRRVLEQGQIPDAKLIHEARKRKQMARQMGGGAEFVPVENVNRFKDEKSRLVREDDNDHSEDDDRIDFSTATNAAKLDREKRLEAFNAARDEERDRMSAGESDPEIEEWEKNQIRKAVSKNKIKTVAHDLYQQQNFMMGDNSPRFLNQDSNSSGLDVYPYSSGVPQPHITSGIINMAVDEIALQRHSERALTGLQLASNGAKQLKPEIILQELSDRLEKLKLSRDRNRGELSRLQADFQLAEKEIRESSDCKPELSSRFNLYQNLGLYVTDVVDCRRCKVPIIDDLEKRMLDLMKARKDRLAERRRQDVKDQKEEVDATVSIMGGTPVSKPPPSEFDAKSRRFAEREGRRTRRKTMREKRGQSKTHKDGLSSDDEETDFDTSSYKSQRDSILQEATLVFEDVNDDFASINGILERFEEWRDLDFDSYKESYAYMCVPKCLAPLIRLQLLSWDPLSDNCELLKFPWVKPLISFGYDKKETLKSISTDPDSRLIPSVVEKVVLPYINRVIELAWDPMRDGQTRNLVNVLNKILDEWAAGASSKYMHTVLTTVISKFKDAVETDVFIPIFSKAVMSNQFTPASVYASRQYWSSVKLLDNLSKWQGLICDKPLQTLALDALLTRYILLGIRTACDLMESADRAKGAVKVLPRAWFSKDGDNRPNGLVQLSRCLVMIIQSADIAVSSNRVAIPELAETLRTLGFTDEAQMVLRKYS